VLRVKIIFEAFILAIKMFYSQNGDTKKELNLALESIQKKTFRVKTNQKNNWFVNFRRTLSLIKGIF
jgi:hypothetical protein